MRPRKLESDELLDLYTDFLICSFSQTTATAMSKMFNGSITHDQITRFLSEKDYDNKDLWRQIKPIIREIEDENGCFIADDCVTEKQFTDENDVITWHFDHSLGRSVKGINTVNCAYTNEEQTVPLGFEIVKKTEKYIDKDGKEKRKSLKTKNELFLEMFSQAIHNQIKFKFVLVDIWFGSVDNMEHINKKSKTFILPLKSNRLVALSKKNKLNGKFQAVSSLLLKTTQEVYLKGLSFPVSLSKQVFTNKDGSTGELYLVTNDLTLEYEEITKIYQKRWKIEEFHKSIKSNTGFAKSPTKTVRTQSNHFFASIYANVKLECLKWKKKKNHFALKSDLYISAIQIAFKDLRKLRGLDSEGFA